MFKATKQSVKNTTQVLILSFMTVAGFSQAAEIELALSSNSAAAELTADSSGVAAGGADLRLGLLFNEDNDYMGNAGLIVRGAAVGERPFDFGLGAGIYYASVNKPSSSVAALALGLGIKYIIPGSTPVSIGGNLFYAPDITTFSDADSLLDFRIRAEVDVLPNATVFIGYRGLSVDLIGSGNRDIDDNGHLGVRIQF